MRSLYREKGKTPIFSDGFIFENLKEFDNHKLVIYLQDSESKLKGFVAIHRGGLLFPSFGATRIWKYKTEADALNDALRLSHIMSYKSALAGLKYGGAKAVIFDSTASPEERILLITAYSQRVNYLGGHFITGADVGVTEHDLNLMIGASRFMVGGKCDAVKHTALGVFCAIEVALDEVFGKDSITDRTFAIQGLGKTGEGLLRLLYKEAKKIYACDVNQEKVREIREKYPEVEIVSPAEIHKLDVDVFSPCALSHTLNFKNVPALNCKIVIGSANNQLEDPKIGELLYKKGVLYGPDYVVNAGGLITVVDEYENNNSNDKRTEERVRNIKNTFKLIIDESKKTKRPTNIVADEMAEKISDGFI